jgi:hypothetical protein
MEKTQGIEFSSKNLEEPTGLSKRPRRKLQNILWVALSVVSAMFTLLAWALSSPVGSSPDDDFHLPSIWCGQGFRESLCQEDAMAGWVQAPQATMANSSCFAFQPTRNGNCDYGNNMAGNWHVNIVTNLYPPVYYWSLSWFASTDIETSTLAMRLANSVLVISAFFLTALVLPIHLRRVPIGGILITLVPLGMFLIASTNPSGWTYPFLIILFSALLGFLSTNKLKPRLILASISIVALIFSAGSRADAAFFGILALVSAWILVPVNKPLLIQNALFSLSLLVSMTLLFFSVRQGSGVISGDLSLVDDTTAPPNVFQNLVNLPDLLLGAFGMWGLGWLDTPLPSVVWVMTFTVFISLVFTSMRWFRVRQLLAVSLLLGALLAIPLYLLQVNELAVGEQVQPRYLLPLIALLGAASLFRESVSTGLDMNGPQITIIAIALFVANTVSLHTNIRRYVTGNDINYLSLDRGIEWWWDGIVLSPNGVWLSGTFFFGVLLFGVWRLRGNLGFQGVK